MASNHIHTISRSSRLAKWMTPDTLENLQSITLRGCKNLGCLNSVGIGKLPYLKVLNLYRMPAVHQHDCDGGFQRLEVLEINRLENLEGFSGLDACDGRYFPRLSKLVIKKCPKLQVLPSLPLSVVELKLKNVGLTELPEFLIPRCDTGSTSSSRSLLKKCSISWCRELRSLEPLKALGCRLEELVICNCPELVQAAASTPLEPSMSNEEENSKFGVDHLDVGDPLLLLIEPLRKLDSVQGLTIQDCGQLESEPWLWLLRNRHSLGEVCLLGASSLQSLPADFRLLYCLIELELEGARQLKSLPELPSSLKKLSIHGADEMLCGRCRKDDGVDWPNIKHIPDIEVSQMDAIWF